MEPATEFVMPSGIMSPALDLETGELGTALKIGDKWVFTPFTKKAELLGDDRPDMFIKT